MVRSWVDEHLWRIRGTGQPRTQWAKGHETFLLDDRHMLQLLRNLPEIGVHEQLMPIHWIQVRGQDQAHIQVQSFQLGELWDL